MFKYFLGVIILSYSVLCNAVWNNLFASTSGYTDTNTIALSLSFNGNGIALGNSGLPGVPGGRHIWLLNNVSNVWANMSNQWSNYVVSAPTALLSISNIEFIVGHFDGSLQYCAMSSCQYWITKQNESGYGVTSIIRTGNNYFVGFSDQNLGMTGKLSLYQPSTGSEIVIDAITSGVGKMSTDNEYMYVPTRMNGLLQVDLDGVNVVNITPSILSGNEYITTVFYAKNINTLIAGSNLSNVYKVALPVTQDSWVLLNNIPLTAGAYISGIAMDSLNNLYIGTADLFAPLINGRLFVMMNSAPTFIPAVGYTDTSSITSMKYYNDSMYVATFAGKIWKQ